MVSTILGDLRRNNKLITYTISGVAAILQSNIINILKWNNEWSLLDIVNKITIKNTNK